MRVLNIKLNEYYKYDLKKLSLLVFSLYYVLELHKASHNIIIHSFHKNTNLTIKTCYKIFFWEIKLMRTFIGK